MERVEMSQEERDKLEWLKRARDRVISQREAAQKIGVSERWVRTLLGRMKKQGDRVVVHGLRGRASNRKLAAEVQAQTLKILKQRDWQDFGPTSAAEQLAKRREIKVSSETLRQWMMDAGYGKAGRHERKRHISGVSGKVTLRRYTWVISYKKTSGDCRKASSLARWTAIDRHQ